MNKLHCDVVSEVMTELSVEYWPGVVWVGGEDVLAPRESAPDVLARWESEDAEMARDLAALVGDCF